MWWISSKHEGRREAVQLLVRGTGGQCQQADAAAGVCENMICVLNLLARFQSGGQHRLVQTVFDGLQEHSRKKITDELTRFIAVDNQEAVKVGEVARCQSMRTSEKMRGSIRCVSRILGWQKTFMNTTSMTDCMWGSSTCG